MALTNVEIQLTGHDVRSINLLRKNVRTALAEHGYHAIADEFSDETQGVLIGHHMLNAVRRYVRIAGDKGDGIRIHNSQPIALASKREKTINTPEGYHSVIKIDTCVYTLPQRHNTRDLAIKNGRWIIKQYEDVGALIKGIEACAEKTNLLDQQDATDKH